TVGGEVLEGTRRTEAELAARTALAALALAAVALQRARGYDLRSRALLVPESASPLSLEFVPSDGGETIRYAFDADAACRLVADAHEQAAGLDFGWTRQPLVLKPMPKLVELIRVSRTLAARDEVEEEGS